MDSQLLSRSPSQFIGKGLEKMCANLNAAVADTCELLVAIIVLYIVSDFVFHLFLQVPIAWFNPVDNFCFFSPDSMFRV